MNKLSNKSRFAKLITAALVDMHATIGGTGKYSGERSYVIVKPLSDTRMKYSFYFVD